MSGAARSEKDGDQHGQRELLERDRTPDPGASRAVGQGDAQAEAATIACREARPEGAHEEVVICWVGALAGVGILLFLAVCVYAAVTEDPSRPF